MKYLAFLSKKFKPKPNPKPIDYAKGSPTQLVRVVNVLRFPFSQEDLYVLEDALTGEKLERPISDVHHYGTTWIATEGRV